MNPPSMKLQPNHAGKMRARQKATAVAKTRPAIGNNEPTRAAHWRSWNATERDSSPSAREVKSCAHSHFGAGRS